MTQYNGKCLCGETAYTALGEPINPHLCSCTMCQKSSGSLTVPWVSFSLESFQWHLDDHLGLYRSSVKTRRCFCKQCGGFLGAIDDEGDSICVTIASLDHRNLMIPGEIHSHKQEAPSWWNLTIDRKTRQHGET